MEQLRGALRRLAKAVVVITSRHEGKRYAMAATAVSELSFDPPSMLVCVNRSASLHAPLSGGAPFAINILHQTQRDIAARCSGAVKGEARFELGAWTVGALGVPCLAGAQAHIICRSDGHHLDHGTHTVFIGDVVDVVVEGAVDPLVYVDGRYASASATPDESGSGTR